MNDLSHKCAYAVITKSATAVLTANRELFCGKFSNLKTHLSENKNGENDINITINVSVELRRG